MVVVREKLTVTQRIRGECPTHARTEIKVRDVQAVIDEPVERGGTNTGPTPTETIVAALIGCTNVIGHKCAEKHGVDVQSLTIDAESTFDRRGTQLVEEIEVPFKKIVLRISLVTDAPDEQIENMRNDLHRFCPVSKLIRNAGTEIEEEWSVTRPQAWSSAERKARRGWVVSAPSRPFDYGSLMLWMSAPSCGADRN